MSLISKCLRRLSVSIIKCIIVLGDYWLSRWADTNQRNISAASDNTALYLGVYGALGATEATTGYARLVNDNYSFTHVS